MSIVTFGEIMLRLTPAVHTGKINTAQAFNVNYAGAESNVASSAALLGNNVEFVTKLPQNQLGDACIGSLNSYGISTKYIKRGGNKIGTYYIEIGASIRPSSVIYDRAYSAISLIKDNEFNWREILRNKKWLHITGITPALSEQCANETIKVAGLAKDLGVKVSFDMNFRRTLWKDASDAEKIFNQILKNTDLLFANTGVLKDVYGMKLWGSDELDKTLVTARAAQKEFNIENLAFTVRKHSSASNNELSGIFISGDQEYTSREYSVDVLDRFGTGDAFAAGCLHALLKKWDGQKIIDFATAAFALKHTIIGDQHTSNENEIISIMEGNTSGHVLR